MKKILCIALITVFTNLPVISAGIRSFEFQGQVTGLAGYNDSSDGRYSSGVRYIPEVRYGYDLGGDRLTDIELSANISGFTKLSDDGVVVSSADVNLYRLTLRYSSSLFETRVGLQKLNFGPGKVLRPLMWFDSIDPRDPFKITDGVYGILARYFFINNTNIWSWVLYGNDKLRGLDAVISDKTRPEYGARMQTAIPFGEAGLTIHQRYVDPVETKKRLFLPVNDGTERRCGLDLNLDIEIGFWCEAVANQLVINSSHELWNYLGMAGMDYTFPWGIHAQVEHLAVYTGIKSDTTYESAEISAVTADYKFGLTDIVNIMMYYNWRTSDTTYFTAWQRSYDKFQVNVLAYSGKPGTGSTTGFSGTGAMVTLSWNY
ncbi:MAG: hypothetical protein WC955_10275 [Elusimicrobiota bacterium]